METRILILGAGPTGLGAAYRLHELGYRNWLIYEKNDYIGGLSASFKDSEGFIWDVGGHVMFSHYKYFDEVIQKLLGDDYLEHQRESWIRLTNGWVPYPFQNNIRYLPKEALLECLIGFYKASKNHSKNSHNFKEWILATFGEGIAKYFMLPYNTKLWRVPLELMSKEWIAERVSVVDFERVLTNVILARDDIGWGPNHVFKFPLRGGTGGLFDKFLPYVKDGLRMKKEAVRIDIKGKTITFSDGSHDHYDVLINTSPLGSFIKKLDVSPEVVKKAAKDLVFNSVYVVGVGLKRKLQSSKCWIYMPENTSPFYRVTLFSNYSPYNVPDANVEKYCSYMCETSFFKDMLVDKEHVVEDTIQGLIDSKFIGEEERKLIVSSYLIEVEKAYPIPTLKRDKALAVIQKYLEQNGVFSRGRFGAWRYEIGNMDHSFMMGVQCVNALLNRGEEEVFNYED